MRSSGGLIHAMAAAALLAGGAVRRDEAEELIIMGDSEEEVRRNAMAAQRALEKRQQRKETAQVNGFPAPIDRRRFDGRDEERLRIAAQRQARKVARQAKGFA